MIILRDIDTLRDGGSVIIKLWATSTDADKFNLTFDESKFVTVMIDYSVNTTTPGVWYNGLKYSGGAIITSEEFKTEVIKCLNQKIEREQFILNKLINKYEPGITKIKS